MKIVKKHDSYLPSSFREAVEAKGGNLPDGVDDLIGDLVGCIIRLNELESGKHGKVSSSEIYEAGKAIDDYTNKIIATLLDINSRKIVYEEVCKLDDIDSDYIRKKYPEGFI